MYSEKIREIRKKLNITQEEISTQIGISYRAYSSYERGDRNPSLEFLEKIVKQYNVNLNWLIADVGSMFNAPQYVDVKDEQNEQLEKLVAQIVDKKMKERGL